MGDRPCAVRASRKNNAYSLQELRDMAWDRGIPRWGKSKRILCADLGFPADGPRRDLGSLPCMSWTLEELREAARRRGIPIYRKKKADLCHDLEPMNVPAENPVSVDPPYLRVPGEGGSRDFRSFIDCRGKAVRRHSSRVFPRGFRLRSHQARVVERILDPETKGLLLFFGMGSGKTFASLCAAEALMECGAVRGVVAVMPAGLISNYRKEMAATGATASKYILTSYESALRNAPNTEGKLMVLDEAHNIRNPEGRSYSVIKEMGNRAAKVLLLTGTPVQNFPHEICSILNIIEDDALPPNRQLFEKYFGPDGLEGGERMDEISKRIVYYTPPHDSSDYPELETYEHFVRMSPEQADLHYQAVGSLPQRTQPVGNVYDRIRYGSFNLKFFTDPRKIANAVKVEGRWKFPKLKEIAERVARAARRGEKSLLYSFFVERGTDILKSLLDEMRVPNAVISGKQSQAYRTHAVKRYNDDALMALIVSDAGSEGLDLKHTTHVHIAEPTWNEEITSQIIGRARRYKSHTRDDVYPGVKVHRYYSVLPDEDNVPPEDVSIANMSADTVIRHISLAKNEVCKAFLKEVIRGSFERFSEEELDIYKNREDTESEDTGTERGDVESEDEVTESEEESGSRVRERALRVKMPKQSALRVKVPEQRALRVKTSPAERGFVIRSNAASNMSFYVALAEAMYGEFAKAEARVYALRLRAKAALHADKIRSQLEEMGGDAERVRARIADKRKGVRWLDICVMAHMLDVDICVLSPNGAFPRFNTRFEKAGFQDFLNRCDASCTRTPGADRKYYIVLNVEEKTYNAVVFE